MIPWARARVIFGATAAGLALVSACGAGDGPQTNDDGNAGSAGSAGNQSGNGSGDGGQVSGGKGGVSGKGGLSSGGTNSAGAGGGVGTPCRADADCPKVSGPVGDLYCSPSGATQGCGACPGLVPPPVNPCSTDADCRRDGGTKICERPCGGICPMGSCVPGCTEETVCPTGMACGATGRCQASACTVNDDCPQDFDCIGGGCFRRPCEADADCDGYCVTDACYSALGACVQPAA